MGTPVRTLGLLILVLLIIGQSVVSAQPPAQPPRPLPPSITGAPTDPVIPVSPASGSQTQTINTTAPISRFQNLQTYPQETVQSVYSMRAGADWLWRMNQANGRFLYGLNPTLQKPLEGDHDLRQALATYALAEAAAFTGDERFTARATQAVLALLTMTKADPADGACRVPTVAPEKCNRIGFAATLVMAIYALPNNDPKLPAQAEELCLFLRKNVAASGAVQASEPAGDQAQKLDPEGLALAPGLLLQALAISNRIKPDANKQDVLARGLKYYHGVYKSQPNSGLAAMLVPAFVEYSLQNRVDKESAAAAFEMTDWLCACQYSNADSRPGWVGGFKPGQGIVEPGFDSVMCARALAYSTRLTRHVPDLTRFHKYRQVMIDGLAFSRRLQFSDENTEHFEKSFRSRFLVGGMHTSPSDGNLRIDASAHLVLAQLAYLQSGAEGRAD